MAKPKTVLIIVGILVAVMGLLPILADNWTLPDFIPVSGNIYQAIIIALGIIAIYFGAKKGTGLGI